MLAEKNPDRVSLKGQLNTRCSGWRNKKQGSCTGILSRENHCRSKPKKGNAEVRDLRGILVWIVVGTKPSGRTLDLYIYILIPKLLEIEKEIVREVARRDKPYLRKSTDRKAQIRKAYVQFSGLICALRSVDFLR